MLIPNLNMHPRDLIILKRERSHWNKVAQVLYEAKTETDVLNMLYVEKHTHNRDYVIRRIYSRYNALRRKRELEELKKYNAYDHIYNGPI